MCFHHFFIFRSSLDIATCTRYELKLHPEENKSKLQQLTEKLRDKFGGLSRRMNNGNGIVNDNETKVE